MAKSIEQMSYAELASMQTRIEKAKVEKQNSERKEVRDKLAAIAKAAGFTIDELFGKGGRRGKGSVAIKYRDPKDPMNTWTGRGRMPRWLVAATKGGKTKKEDFLIK